MGNQQSVHLEARLYYPGLPVAPILLNELQCCAISAMALIEKETKFSG